MVAQKNIIKKVKIGVNTPSLENGTWLKNKLGEFFKEEIFPEMDNYFNSIQKNHSKIIRIENISIEINVEEKKSLIELKSLIINEIKKKINKTNLIENNSGSFQSITSEQNEIEAFFYFLKNGSLPWWLEENTNFWGEFIEKNYFKKEILDKLKTLLSTPEIRKRLIFQFDDSQLFQIISAIIISLKKKSNSLKIPKKNRYQFWETVITHALNNKKELVEIFKNTPLKDVEKIVEMANKIFNLNIKIGEEHLAKIKEANKEHSEKTDSIEVLENLSKIENEEILLKNAGLILLHPFLKMFFEKLDFLLGKNLNPEKIDEAIHVLHYLSTGKEQAYEHELLIEKIICNVPFHQTLNRHINLTIDQKIACEVLLQAVLEHWSVLKSNSTQIIQNEFLQREGKLIISEEKQTLIVERKAQDILLDKLPWNIHLIKIPWMEKILFVEW